MQPNLYPFRIKESYLFYSVLFINICFLFFTKFYPSMDGPSHLYNSNLINHLLIGNKALNEFYTINPMPIPNWISNCILSLFHILLPGWLSEKFLLIIYITGMALSFRLLIRYLNPTNPWLSFFIFPFIHSFLFHLGFYNYSISFILFFSTLLFWLKYQESNRIPIYIFLFLLLTLTYLSNVLTFVFLGITLGSFIIFNSYNIYFQSKDLTLALKAFGNKLLRLFIVSLPGLVAFGIFYKNVTFFPSEQKIEIKELVKWLNDVRCLIVYNYQSEEVITAQFLHLLLILFGVGIFLRYKEYKKNGISVNITDCIIVPFLISLILYFIIPDGSSAGMMSDRYCLLIYILALIWILSQPLPLKLGKYIGLIVIILHFWLLFYHMHGSIRNLNKDAVAINKASIYIKENSIVLPVNLSENWLEGNFSNYLGVDKPMIIMENFEADVAWFPIKWNTTCLPKVLVGNLNSISGLQWRSNLKSKTIKRINYIFLYGNTSKINDKSWYELSVVLKNDFKLKYCSTNRYVMLFENLQ